MHTEQEFRYLGKRFFAENLLPKHTRKYGLGLGLIKCLQSQEETKHDVN